MRVAVEKIRAAEPAEWDALWNGCEYSTYFHSREWAEIWKEYSEGKIFPDPKMVCFSDNKKALLPLLIQKSPAWIFPSYLSSMAGTFGGWISKDNLEVDHAALLTKFLLGLGNLTWRLNPYDKNVFQTDVGITRDDQTHALNLTAGYDTLYQGMSRGHRSAARKGEKSGIRVIRASSLEEWREYYQIYQSSLKRWNNSTSSVYGWKLFHEMARKNSPNIHLWLAVYHDKIVAGALCFYAKNHAVYWHGAALEKFFNLRPINFLFCEVLKHACQKGLTWFDFNPSGAHKGVKTFKKRFGAQELSSPVVHHKAKARVWLETISSFFRR